MRSSRLGSLAAVLAVAAIALPCSAQYAWTDQNGVRQYSDRPPPASVPSDRILDRRGGTSSSAKEAASTPTSASHEKTPTLAERNAAFLKRRAEQAEKDKKAAEQARLDKENAKSCERARRYQQTLASGQRVATTASNGERAYLTDQQRSDELRDVARVLEKCH